MANDHSSVLALLALWGGALLGLIVGVTYFAKAHQEAGLLSRLASSAFGPSLAVLFIVAALMWPERHRYSATGVQVYYWLQLLPLLLLFFALVRYPGPRRLHWYLVPVGMVAWAWTFALGWLFIHGE